MVLMMGVSLMIQYSMDWVNIIGFLRFVEPLKKNFCSGDIFGRFSFASSHARALEICFHVRFLISLRFYVPFPFAIFNLFAFLCAVSICDFNLFAFINSVSIRDIKLLFAFLCAVSM